MSIIRRLNYQLIHQLFDHAFNQNILHMAKLGIHTGLPKSTPKLSHNFHACIIDNWSRLPRHPNVSTVNLYPDNCFHIDFSFFNKVSFWKFTSYLTIVYANTGHLFGYPIRSEGSPLQPINTFIKLSLHHGYRISIFLVNEGGELDR